MMQFRIEVILNAMRMNTIKAQAKAGNKTKEAGEPDHVRSYTAKGHEAAPGFVSADECVDGRARAGLISLPSRLSTLVEKSDLSKDSRVELFAPFVERQR
eukprot:1938242-Pleurochrysis_carterae.AAC.1